MGGPGSGGARKGSGNKKGSNGKLPKSETRKVSDAWKRGMARALAKKAKETGRSVQDLIAEKLYDPNTQDTALVGLARLVNEVIGVKESHEVKETISYEPVILPALREDPTKLEEWRGEVN